MTTSPARWHERGSPIVYVAERALGTECASPASWCPAPPNILLNPLHPDAPRLQIVAAWPYPFDARPKS